MQTSSKLSEKVLINNDNINKVDNDDDIVKWKKIIKKMLSYECVSQACYHVNSYYAIDANLM